MEALVALGVDVTYFYQLVLVIVFYLVLKNLLFKKLLFVLQTREEQTTKRTDSASATLVEVDKMKSDFEKKIAVAHSKAQDLLTNKKQEVVKREGQRLKAEDEKLAEVMKGKREELKSEVETLRTKALESSSSLSGDLLNKIIQ